MAEARFEDLVKAVVDVERGVMAVGGELQEAVAEDEAAYAQRGLTMVEVPSALVPKVRRLIAEHSSRQPASDRQPLAVGRKPSADCGISRVRAGLAAPAARQESLVVPGITRESKPVLPASGSGSSRRWSYWTS